MSNVNIVYRVNITPEFIQIAFLTTGALHVLIESELPKDARYLWSGWDYQNRCVFLEYLDNESPAKEGEEIRERNTIIVTPTYTNLEPDQ